MASEEQVLWCAKKELESTAGQSQKGPIQKKRLKRVVMKSIRKRPSWKTPFGSPLWTTLELWRLSFGSKPEANGIVVKGGTQSSGGSRERASSCGTIPR